MSVHTYIHTYKYSMSPICMSHVKHTNESRHTRRCAAGGAWHTHTHTHIHTHTHTHTHVMSHISCMIHE